jgi:hypothetical protein
LLYHVVVVVAAAVSFFVVVVVVVVVAAAVVVSPLGVFGCCIPPWCMVLVHSYTCTIPRGDYDNVVSPLGYTMVLEYSNTRVLEYVLEYEIITS